MARTNIVLNDELVADAMRLTGLKSRRALVDYALRDLVRRKKQRDLLKLAGKIHWEGDLNEMRRQRTFRDPN